jgi:hypothetical protein
MDIQTLDHIKCLQWFLSIFSTANPSPETHHSTCLLLHNSDSHLPFSTLTMQSDYGSLSPSQQSEEPFPPNAPLGLKEFVLSREDAVILQEYVDEFQEGDADVRNTVIAAAMAELCSVRPPTDRFNKVEVSKVDFQGINILGTLTNISPRRLESGFTITTLSLSDNMSSSPASGPLETHSIICAGMKS